MFGFFKKKEKEEQKENKGLIARLREGLTKTRSGFTGRLDQLLFGKRKSARTCWKVWRRCFSPRI